MVQLERRLVQQSILPNSALIVCTRNRDIELQKTLKTLSSLENIPGTLIVVDSSDNKNGSKETVLCFAKNHGGKTYLLNSRHGLPHQRNVALTHLFSLENHGVIDFVFFLDDDVDVGANFFADALAFFEESPKVIAIGCTDSNQELSSRSKIGRFLLGEPKEGGKIGPSGLVSTVNPGQGFVESDWIAGGSMVIKSRIMEIFRFDGSRRMFGEDVEASIRLAQLGQIGVNRDLKISHRSAMQGKIEESQANYQHDSFRWELASKLPGRVTGLRVLLASITMGLGKLSLSKFSSSGFVGHFGFIWDVMLRGELERDCVDWGWSIKEEDDPQAYEVLLEC